LIFLIFEHNSRDISYQCVSQVIHEFWNQEKDVEIESTFYRDGAAYLAGLSDRIYARQTAPAFETQREAPVGEFIGDRSSHAEEMNLRRKGNYAYSNNLFSTGPENAMRFPQ
jgi:hypothetical protein